MGLYINTGNEGFRTARNSEYVDKSGLIDIVNSTLNTEFQFSCVSRARRFGKSMAAKMLNAYYDKSCQSEELFNDLIIAEKPSYRKYLNKFPVIFIDMTNFVTRYRNDDNIVNYIQSDVMTELKLTYKNVDFSGNQDMLSQLYAIVQQEEPQKFIVIIDEWDAILREFRPESPATDRYVDFLRSLFKSGNSQSVFAGVYMTGILPIKKYNTQSALNNFEEYTMVQPGVMASTFGFTEDEVAQLCVKHQMDKEQFRIWYDGYQISGQKSIYNPLSVIRALNSGYCSNYWSKTGTYETVSKYIEMNFDGLKDDIIRLLAGENCKVNTQTFSNDLNVINSKHDVLTVLMHLGYLAYDREKSECYIPNKEVRTEFEGAITDVHWDIVSNALIHSEQLLHYTLSGNTEKVIESVERIHSDNTSILQYNDENSLACVLTIAFYTARNYYKFVRELPAGNGFADIVLIPYKNINMPAVLLELKYNQSAYTAINQIKEKHYSDALKDYAGEIVLVGIDYNKQNKKHTCLIERVRK